MATMVTLSAEQADRLNDLVAGGRFSSTDEAVRQLLSHALDDEYPAPYSPKTLAHLFRGMEEAARGETVSQQHVEAFFDNWQRNG